MTISGRNKACILYASEIQDKIDGLTYQIDQSSDGYFKKNQNIEGNIKKLRESITNSRKLLKIKKKEYENIYSEIAAVSGSIK